MKHLLFLIILFLNFFSFSQSVQSPEIDYVTVNQTSLHPVIHWTYSDISQTDGYAIKRFIRSYPSVPDNTWHTVKIINNPATLYFEDNTNVYGTAKPNVQTEIYEVTAFKISGTDTTYSLPSQAHKTIFLNGKFNYCTKNISLIWNNYTGWGQNFEKYEIYESINSGSYAKINETLFNDTSILIPDINYNTAYRFYIKALRNNGIESLSPVFEISTPDFITPSFIIITKAEVTENKFILDFNYDTSTEFSKSVLYRKKESENTYTEVMNEDFLSGNNRFVVENFNPKEINKFFIAAIDSCENIVLTSDTISNIVLNVINSDTEKKIILEWEDIFSDKNYQIFRKTGNDFLYTDETAEHSYIDDVNALLNDQFFNTVSGGKICYYIKFEDTGFTNISNIECSKQKEIIIFPNAFNPKSNIPENRVFKPKAAFISDYLMTVYGPFGDIIFESSNPDVGWDGKLKNGKLAPVSSYLYCVKYKNADGIIRKYKNYVTLVY